MDQPKRNVTKSDQVKVDCYSELMPNYFPESDIQGDKDIQVVPLAPDRPLLFCLDKTGRLQALVRRSGAGAAWGRFLLSGQAVRSFDVWYDAGEGSFRVAMIEGNSLRLSARLSVKTTDFEKLDKAMGWTSPASPPAGEQADVVSLGTGSLLYATSGQGKDARYYLVDLDSGGQTGYTLPEHGVRVQQFGLGTIDGDEGVFLLYTIGQEQSMIFQSFPDPVYNKTTKYRFESGEPVQHFATLADADGNHALYTAGKGVHLFERDPDGPGGGNIPARTLTQGTAPIDRIAVARLVETRSVWFTREGALLGMSNHYYDTATARFRTGTWTEPVALAERTGAFCCVRGQGVASELFAVSREDKASRLLHLWQDSVTSLWSRGSVAVSEVDVVREMNSYSLHIRFSAADMTQSFAGQRVYLSADSHHFIYIDHESYLIGPDKRLEFKLGTVPELTLICPVEDLAAASVYLEADFLEDKREIGLADAAVKRLGDRIRTGQDLKNARRPDGTPLVPASVSPDKLDSAAQGIQHLLTAGARMGGGGQGLRGSAGYSAQFSLSYAATGVAAGMPMTAPARGMSLGDFLMAAWHGIEKAVHFTVEALKEGVRIVIKVGEEIFNWIAKTAREIAGFVQKVLESVKVFFKDVFDFLAFLFDWQAIVDTKNALKAYTNNAISGLRAEIGHIKSFVDRTLDELIGKLTPELLELPAHAKSMGMQDVQKKQPSASADPRSNWLNSKKSFVTRAGDGGGKLPDIPTELSQVFSDFVAKVTPHLQSIGQGFVKELEELRQGFSDLIDGKIGFGTLLELLVRKLAGLGLFTARHIIDILLESLEALLAVAQYGLNKAWHIPLISDIYKKISGNAEMSFLDVVCLLIAIPTTILYKIGEGEAPFAKTDKEAFVQAGSRVFRLNLENA